MFGRQSRGTDESMDVAEDAVDIAELIERFIQPAAVGFSAPPPADG
jgi:hypothetical protein